MFVLIDGPKIVPLTRQLAKNYRDMPACERDRPLSEHRLTYLTKEAQAGRFRTCEWASAFCVEDKNEYRVNGKHTSTIFADHGPDIDLKGVHIIVSKFKCPKREDVASLYATFDNKGSARNFRDINLVFAGSVPELNVIPATSIHTCVSGMAYATWEGNQKRLLADERAGAIVHNVDFILWFHSMVIGDGISGKDKDLLRRSPVAAAMFRTYKKSKSEAGTFWAEVRDASNPDNKSPTRTLNKFLLISSPFAGKGVQSKTTVPVREMYIKCQLAWNAWRKGEQLSVLKYHAESATPKVA